VHDKRKRILVGLTYRIVKAISFIGEPSQNIHASHGKMIKFAVTGITGFCPIYSIFNISTRKRIPA